MHTTYPKSYTPGALLAIEREEVRKSFHSTSLQAMQGSDTWMAYEVSWLREDGVPAVAIFQMVYPSSTPYLIESKSLKLYLMSLNQHTFNSQEAVHACIQEDLSKALASDDVVITLSHPDEFSSTLSLPQGVCIDHESIDDVSYDYGKKQIVASGDLVEEKLYSHLLRSVCPITGQPDYGTLSIHYRGPTLDRKALLAYIVSFRNHGDYHEHCAERMFVDLLDYGHCESLALRCTYTRRGGIDISPERHTMDRAPGVPYRRFSRH